MFSHWSDFKSHHSDKLHSRIRKGIPDGLRGLAWRLIIDSDPPPDRPSLDALIAAGASRALPVIEADVPRTMPGHVMFTMESILASLQRVLTAYSNYECEVGYVQGMGFIAAMLLSYIEEDAAFWCFATLMSTHRLLFANKFEGLEKLNHAWELITEMKCPAIAAHLRNVEVMPILYTPNWWLSAFMGMDLPSELRMRIFDQYIAFGYRALFAFGLVIFSLEKVRLSSESSGVCLQILQNPGELPAVVDCRAAIKKYNRKWLSEKEYSHCLKQANIH
jgi:hypothetical protein